MNLTWTETEMKRTRKRWRVYDRDRHERRRAALSILATIALSTVFLVGAPQLALVILLAMPVMAWLIWLVI